MCIKETALKAHDLHNHHEARIPLKCEQCFTSFSSIWAFNQHKKAHLNSVHNNNLRKSPEIVFIDPSTSEYYECTLCKRSVSKFKTKLNLEEHIKCKHTLTCDICHKTYSGPNKLRYHAYRVHNAEVKLNAFCAICDTGFPLKKCLVRHMRVHGFVNVETKVKCGLCKKKIVKSTLRYHISTMHEKKQFVCEICGAAFARSDYLKKHMFKHNKERNHICSYCGGKFSRRDNLKAHEKKHAVLGDRMKPKPPVWKRP